MTSPFHLKCLDCDAIVPPTVRILNCPDCGGLFEVAYTAHPSTDSPLPLQSPASRLSLGEGATPVIELRRTASQLGLSRLWAKLEYIAPTGSFKDRGSSVLISVAREHRVTEFVEDSSGNAGASLAAYAAAAGIKAHVFAPSSASPGKLRQITVFGAELHTVDGPRQAATDAARRFVEERGIVYLSHNLSPYFSEGMKAFSYEVAQSPAKAARHIVIPVGNGSLLIGAKRGFDELRDRGSISALPKLHCVQANSVRPVVAVINGEDWDFGRAEATVASGIAVSKPPRIEQIVDAVSLTGGTGIAVPDGSILDWQAKLARTEGIFCEATSAATFAGLERLISDGVIERGDEVLVPVTGSGLKEHISP